MKKKNPLILVTNDDGITANGIRLLIKVARKFGNVIVVAPDMPQSAKSHSITQNIPISYKKIKFEENYKEYSCSGTPVDCVKIAIHEVLKAKPDFILSGINHGTNSGISVLYSGTMAAAIEGSLHGVPSIGFSVNNYNEDANLKNAIPIIEQIISDTIKNSLPSGVCLNVNFPNIENEEPKGYKICRATSGVWEEKFISSHHPHRKNNFWVSGEFINAEPNAEDTDEFAMKHGYASIVPIKVNFTENSFIDILKKRLID